MAEPKYLCRQTQQECELVLSGHSIPSVFRREDGTKLEAKDVVTEQQLVQMEVARRLEEGKAKRDKAKSETEAKAKTSSRAEAKKAFSS